MAWIESHQKLKDEPKLFDLMVAMSWSKAETIGRLHMFWWWCVDHAENGDLRQYNDTHLALAVELNPEQGKEFTEALVKSGFLERSPYFRIANWWKYSAKFLQSRYSQKPEVWQKISKLYDEKLSIRLAYAKHTIRNTTNLTNQTVPNQQYQEKTKLDFFASLWSQYPNKDGRKAAERHFLATVKTEQDKVDIAQALKNYLRSEKVKAGYIKNGSTWFNNWRDWIDIIPAEDKFKSKPCPKHPNEFLRPGDECVKCKWEKEAENDQNH